MVLRNHRFRLQARKTALRGAPDVQVKFRQVSVTAASHTHSPRIADDCTIVCLEGLDLLFYYTKGQVRV
jgi:hypothetical protein